MGYGLQLADQIHDPPGPVLHVTISMSNPALAMISAVMGLAACSQAADSFFFSAKRRLALLRNTSPLLSIDILLMIPSAGYVQQSLSRHFILIIKANSMPRC